uniref:KIX domain-containing protein n=1 Tax=Strongyloides stercoralis TaxID=6248 RepID=A0A0K0ES35_STRER
MLRKQNMINIHNEYKNSKNEKSKCLVNHHSSDFEDMLEKEKKKENYYYDLARKMLDIYDELYEGYHQSLNEEKQNEGNVNYNWKENLSFEVREKILNKLTKTIYPYDNRYDENSLLNSLKKYLFEIEKEIYENVECGSTYYSNLRHKIFEIQYELRKYSLYQTNTKKQESENINSNWKNEIKIGFRKYFMYKLLKAIYPHNIRNLPPDILDNLKIYTFKIENEIFEKATSKEMYFQNMTLKECEMRFNQREKLSKNIETQKKYELIGNIDSEQECQNSHKEYFSNQSTELNVLKNVENSPLKDKNKIFDSYDAKENFDFDSVEGNNEEQVENCKLTCKYSIEKDNNFLSNTSNSINVNIIDINNIDEKIEDKRETTEDLQSPETTECNFKRDSLIKARGNIVDELIQKLFVAILSESINLIF